MTYSLEAAVVLPMALQQLKHWQRWASKANFQLREVRDKQQNILASRHYTHKERGDTFSNFISHWLFPAPSFSRFVTMGETIGEVQLNCSRQFNQPFYLVSLAVLTGCILLLASGIAITLTRHFAMARWKHENITDVVHDVRLRSNRNFPDGFGRTYR